MAHDLTRLSHADLEDLAMDLLQANWGVTLECFRTGRDDGIDLRHSSCQGGTTIVQCKHFAGSGLRTLLSHLRRHERPKVLALAPSRYVLVTSVPVSPRNKASIVAALAPAPIVEADVIGADEIEALLRRFPTVEKAHLKLWLTSAAVLERVLHNAEQVQTDFHVEKVREKISLYVRSPSYDAALGILERERVVVISGPPGIGKSTLADLLLFAHLERGYQPVVVRRGIAEAKRLFNRTARQVFYFDDFLGETFLGDRSDFLGHREDAEIADFMEMVSRSRSSRFVLATRDHLLNSAYGLSERFGREKRLFEARRCVLDVKGYGPLDRARILYNHIHFSNLPPRLKKALVADAFYLRVLRHGNFNPRLVEWLCTPRNVCGATPTSYRATVLGVLDEPEMVWRGAFEGELSEPSRSLLLALYSVGGTALRAGLEPAWRALNRHRSATHGFVTSAEDWRDSLQELEGGFLQFPDRRVIFANPSVKDFLDGAISGSPDHGIQIVEAATSFRQLSVVWNLARSAKGGRLRERLRRDPGPLLAAVTRLLRVPAWETVRVAGGIATRELDITFEARLAIVVEMAADLGGDGFLDAAADLVAIVDRDWLERRPDFRSAARFLRRSSGAAHASMVRLREAVRSGLLASLTRTPDLEGFDAVMDETATTGRAQLSSSERSVMSTAFVQYLAKQFDDDLANADGEGEHEKLLANVSAVSDWLGVSSDAAQSRVSEILDGFREDEEEAEAVHPVAGAPSVQAGDDASIRDLFDGLTV